MEDFAVGPAPIEMQSALVRVARFGICPAHIHHVRHDLMRKARVPGCLLFVEGSLDRLFLRQMRGSDLVLVEHHLFRDIGRPAIPVGIVAIELDGNNCTRADIGAPPPEAGNAHEFKTDMKVRMLHAEPREVG